MIDINIYRSRIGLFGQKTRNKKFLNRRQYYQDCSSKEYTMGRNVLQILKIIFKIVSILCLLPSVPTYLAQQSVTSDLSECSQTCVLSDISTQLVFATVLGCKGGGTCSVGSDWSGQMVLPLRQAGIILRGAVGCGGEEYGQL